jgi:hypothetical protein
MTLAIAWLNVSGEIRAGWLNVLGDPHPSSIGFACAFSGKRPNEVVRSVAATSPIVSVRLAACMSASFHERAAAS